MGLKLTNNAVSRLASGIAAGDLSLSVTPGDGALFPTLGAGDYFPATLVRASDSAVEIIKVTARATDVFTIERAQESTTALAFVANDRIELRLTAKTFGDQATEVATHAATSKATPVDADEIPLVDSAASNVLKKLTWANLKATMFAAFGALLAAGTSKATPVDADTILLSDSAASDATKKLTWANLKAEIFSSWGALINGGTSKATPVDDDAFSMMDSAASNATKKLTWANLKATLKTYFDTLYSSVGTVQGSHKNLQASSTGTDANVSISADEIVVESASNGYQTLRNVSVTAAMTASGANGLDDSSPQTITVTIASPGVLTLNDHGFPANAAVVLGTTGALPTGLAAGTTYYVVNPATNTFQLSATKGGAAINTSGTQSGVHTIKSVLAASSFYSKWVIWNGTTTAALLSSSATNPVLPSGYTHKARTGWVYTDATANKYPLTFKQFGKSVEYGITSSGNLTAMRQMVTGVQGNISTPTLVAVAVGNFVPSTASAINLVSHVPDGGSGVSGNMAAPNNSYGDFRSASNPPPLVNFPFSGGSAMAVKTRFTLESTNIYFAGQGTQSLYCAGWEDNL